VLEQRFRTLLQLSAAEFLRVNPNPLEQLAPARHSHATRSKYALHNHGNYRACFSSNEELGMVARAPVCLLLPFASKVNGSREGRQADNHSQDGGECPRSIQKPLESGV